MTDELTVRHLDGDQFAIDVRGHTMLVDQPVDAGGLDEAPTPTELFVAGLASCVAFFARRFLARHELATEGLGVTASYLIGGRPVRVTGIELQLIVPSTVPDERLAALLAVASHCTVHQTLQAPPSIEITLAKAAETLL